MADFLDRKALKKLFDAANAIRRQGNGRFSAQKASVYLMRTPAVRGTKKADFPPIEALKAIHETAISDFGGRVVRDRPDGLAGIFEKPIDALRAALHANHVADLAREMLSLSASRVAITHGEVAFAENSGVAGRAYDRATRIVAYAGPYAAIFEASILKTTLSGYHDIMANTPRRVMVPGLGTVSLISVRPLGLKPELDDELEEVDSELRSGTRRTKK
jgi:hypothetical protein